MSISITPKRGVACNYGPRGLDMQYGGNKGTKDDVIKAVWDFTYDDVVGHGSSELLLTIPAGAVVKGGYLQVVDTMTGLTDLDAVLVDAGTGANAVVLVANATITDGSVAAAGAAVGAKLAADKQLEVAITGATAGRARIVVEYFL